MTFKRVGRWGQEEGQHRGGSRGHGECRTAQPGCPLALGLPRSSAWLRLWGIKGRIIDLCLTGSYLTVVLHVGLRGEVETMGTTQQDRKGGFTTDGFVRSLGCGSALQRVTRTQQVESSGGRGGGGGDVSVLSHSWRKDKLGKQNGNFPVKYFGQRRCTSSNWTLFCWYKLLQELCRITRITPGAWFSPRRGRMEHDWGGTELWPPTSSWIPCPLHCWPAGFSLIFPAGAAPLYINNCILCRARN